MPFINAIKHYLKKDLIIKCKTYKSLKVANDVDIYYTWYNRRSLFPSIDKAADYSYTKLTNLGEPDTCMSIIQMQFKVHCNFRISFLIYVQICFNHKGWIHSDIICILKGVGGGVK